MFVCVERQRRNQTFKCGRWAT